MKLVQLVIENFRGAPDGVYSFVDPGTGAPRPLTIITGGPRSGKTALIEAIAAIKECIGAYGAPPEPARLLRRGARSGSIAATWLFSADEMERTRAPEPTWTAEVKLGEGLVLPVFGGGMRTLFAAYSDDPARAKFEYFPSNRRLSFAAAPPLPAASEARLRLGKSPDKYGSVRRALIELAQGEGLRAVELLRARGVLLESDCADALAPYKKSLAGLLPDLRLLGVETRDSGPAVLFERRDGGVLGIEELSESEQQAVLFCVTFVKIGLNHSIVLIDEPELHVHAAERARILAAIAGLGADNQLIVATGADEIVSAAPPQRLIRLGGR
jgi:hypothetical protein